MALQYSVTVRNAQLDALETAIGAAPLLVIAAGAQPANCAAADGGATLATLTLPSDWMNAASSGSKTKLGTWENPSVVGGGTAGHFRIYDSTGTTCHIQGSVTVTGGGGLMELNDVDITAGKDVQITTFTITAGNQ